MKISLKILPEDNKGPVMQTKPISACFARSTQPGSFFVFAYGNHKQNFPK